MIPNILWQTWKTKTIPEAVKHQAESWKQSNPQLEIKLYDNKECSDFILEHFGEEIHRLYLSLPQPIMRADFWRVAVVYVYGGYYADLDITCNTHISKFIKSTVSAVFTKELDNIANFFFGAEPKHPVLKLTLDRMIQEAAIIVDKETQSYGMHSLHQSVRDYYKITNNYYLSNDLVEFLHSNNLKHDNVLIHSVISFNENILDYTSWRVANKIMQNERNVCHDILFFTTFNKNGYELYGKEWIYSFIKIANYYNKVRAKIYYEGFNPKINHPSINWIKYEDAIHLHSKWKKEYLSKTKHSDYVKTMTVRFSHKAFVIQHVLDNNFYDYMIWLDGDCIFKNADYSHFPSKLLGDKFLACQVEHNRDLNHVESGILIFKGTHSDTKKFNEEFKKWYLVENIIPMGQPYDGFLVYKSLLTTGLNYVDLNKDYGKGGIQSDPSMTFCHPEIKSKFIHNIGWTGKTQYSDWDDISNNDLVYKKIEKYLFDVKDKKIKNAFSKLQKLKSLRNI